MLKQRIITAVIMAIVVVGCILQQDTIWTRLLFAVVLLAASFELIRLTLRTTPVVALVGASLFVGFYWWSGSLINAVLVYWQSLAGVALWILIAIGLCFYRHHGN